MTPAPGFSLGTRTAPAVPHLRTPFARVQDCCLLAQRGDNTKQQVGGSPALSFQKGTALGDALARSWVVTTCLNPYVAATCATSPMPATSTGLLPRLAARLLNGVCASTT